MDLARALRELEIVERIDTLAAMKPAKRLQPPPGFWSRKRPRASGVYLTRFDLDDNNVQVRPFDPTDDEATRNAESIPLHPFEGHAVAVAQYWYCRGDKPHFPTRADSPGFLR